MFLVRKLVLLALKFNILFSAKHLPGKVNIYSDALSRLQVSKFQTLMPQADLQPTRIPPLPELLADENSDSVDGLENCIIKFGQN